MSDLSPNRRQILRAAAALGIGGATFHRALATQVPEQPRKGGPAGVTPEMVKAAEWVAGITLSDAERAQVARSLSRSMRDRTALQSTELPNHVPPAFQFNPTPDSPPDGNPGAALGGVTECRKPDSTDDLAFLSIPSLAHLIRTKQVSSVELTKLALDRLQKYDPALYCVVTITDDLAFKQAKRADEETAAGKIRGPLHGLPWGAKDLIAYPGYKTTWGAAHYRDQTIDTKATVAKRLEDAGAVLVAKLTLGALAMGDQWFGGRTRSPWNVKTGSSGSSAGSAAAVAAGLVPFAIGSETSGSIISPSRQCRVTGLRPTFGRVSRYGCMTLSWTLDKIGTLCRSAEDCAYVLGAIHGADGLDPTAVTRPFNWPGWPELEGLKGLKIGYAEEKGKESIRPELTTLKELGAELIPIQLPGGNRAASLLMTILNAECASAFEDITLKGVREGLGQAWPNTFRAGRFVTAVDYLRANRLRTLLMQEMAEVMKKVDVYVSRGYEFLTNLTGHPAVSVPFGEPGARGTPGLLFTGQLFGESDLLKVAKDYQEATRFHLKRPDMSKVTRENAGN